MHYNMLTRFPQKVLSVSCGPRSTFVLCQDGLLAFCGQWFQGIPGVRHLQPVPGLPNILVNKVG